ncbi:MAG: hypothetical protein ACE10C_15735, partial [Candidatus Binatia bacterium]
STTVKMLTDHKVTVSEHNGGLQWECDKCGLRTPDDWCEHMYTVICNDAAKVPAFQAGYLNEAHQIVVQHEDVVPVLIARLMEIATKNGSHVREVQQLEAAIARHTSHQ